MPKPRLSPPDALSHELRDTLRWIRFLNEFSRIERLIWTPGAMERERNGSHCYQLVMLVWFFRSAFLPSLNTRKLILYAAVHDLPELYAGETPAFISKFGEFNNVPTHKDKKERELQAIKRIEDEWNGRFPECVEALHAYDRKEDEESRLVYALDKFLAEANIYLDGGYTDKYLGVTLDAKLEYKRAKIAAHPLVLKYYDELKAFVECNRPDALYHEGMPRCPSKMEQDARKKRNQARRERKVKTVV